MVDLTEINKEKRDKERGYCSIAKGISRLYHKDTEGISDKYKQLSKQTSLEWFYPEKDKPKTTAEKLGFKIDSTPITETNKSHRIIKVGKEPKWMRDTAKEKLKYLNSGKLSGIDIRTLKEKTEDAFKNTPSGYINPNLLAYGKSKLKDPAIQSMLQQSKDPTSELSQKLKAVQILDRKASLARLGTPEYLRKITEAHRINKLITPAYIETAKTALGAFDKSLALSHRDILSRVSNYTTATDQVLALGINAQIARDMLKPHKALLESCQNWETPKKPTKKEIKKENKEPKKDNQKLEELSTKQKKESNAEISKLKEIIKRLEKEAGEKDVINLALATTINQQDTAPAHKNNEPLIKDVWLEKGKVKRPSTFTPPAGTAKSMGVANAIECVNMFFDEKEYYPTENESWKVIRNSDSIDTGYEVEKYKNNVKVELKEWSREAHKEFFRLRFS